MESQSKNITLKKKWFVKNQGNDNNIEDYYEFASNKDVLGTGTYGSVIKALDKRTKLVRAIKIIPKSRVRN